MKGKPVFVAFQAEGREWVRLFTRKTLERLRALVGEETASA